MYMSHVNTAVKTRVDGYVTPHVTLKLVHIVLSGYRQTALMYVPHCSHMELYKEPPLYINRMNKTHRFVPSGKCYIENLGGLIFGICDKSELLVRSSFSTALTFGPQHFSEYLVAVYFFTKSSKINLAVIVNPTGDTIQLMT